MWALYDFPSRALLPHHRRNAVLCSETIPSQESSYLDAHPCDGAYPVAGEIHRLPALPSRQPQTTESRAGSDTAGPGEPSQLPGEVALQRDLVVFPRRQIRRQRMEPFRWFSVRGPRNRPFPHCSFAVNSDRFTRVDQPTIMLRSVSHPSTKTRITCGTTKRIKSHMSQKCQTRAALYPPKSAASQWSCMGL